MLDKEKIKDLMNQNEKISIIFVPEYVASGMEEDEKEKIRDFFRKIVNE